MQLSLFFAIIKTVIRRIIYEKKSSPKKLSISGDSIAVTPEEILQYPLCPSLELEIPKGTLCIPKNPSFNTKINIKIRTSGEVIWLDSIKSKKEGGNE